MISQTFSGAGTATATYNRDYVELFNASANPVSLNGMAIQYGAATGNLGSAASLIFALPNVTLQPGQYYLVGLATAAGTSPLPIAVDNTNTNTINMAGASGKVALTNTTTALGCGATATPCTLPDSRIIDIVSYGASNTAEGGATVNNGVGLTVTQGAVRKSNGCQDTNNNNNDFNVVTNPVPRNTASTLNPCVAASNIDLTITRSTFDTTVGQNDTVTYDIVVSNGGTDNASNVKVNFIVPAQLTFANTSSTCGFTASNTGNAVTFTGGTVNGGGSCSLTVSATAPTAGVKATSLGSQTVVDPDNTISETNESNNTATGDVETRVLFPSVVTGLFGRPSLAQLLADIADIGGGSRIVLTQNLNESSTINLPDFKTLDLAGFVISGTANINIGSSFGASLRTSHPNGLGNQANPGNLQTSGTITYTGNTSIEYYAAASPAPAQNAYGNPANVRDFRINNPNGLNVFAPFNVSGDFFLTDGIINNGSNTITLAAFSRINGDSFGQGSETSFIAGRMTKFIPSFADQPQLGLAATFTFPVGTLGGPQAGYSPLRADNFFGSDPGSGLTVQAFDTNSPGVRTPSLSRYWQIDEIGNMITDLRFVWRTGDDTAITNPAIATIIRNNQIACDANCTIDVPNRTASITGVSEFSPWSVAQTGPTAAGVTISGRVLNSIGRGEARARVYVTDANGVTRTVTTNNFGFYRIEGLQAGETYIVNVFAKQAQYNPRVVTASSDVSELDFTPQN